MSNTQQLMAMGFSKDAVTTALAMNNDNFDNALSLLLNQANMVENVAAPPSYSQATAVRVPTSTNTPSSNNVFESLAQALSSDRPALDAVYGIVEKLIVNPNDQTVTVLQLGGSLAPIKSSEPAVNFLKELGYISRSGFLVVKTPQGLHQARSAIQNAMSNEQYCVSSILESSRLAAIEEARYQRNLLRQKQIRPEPQEGSGQVSTRLVFHFNEDGAPSKTLERKFEPDECLYDVIHFLGTLDEEVLDAHSWELNENAAMPFWWCNGWELSDITLRPPTKLSKADATKTLQGLGLWPSAQISVKVTKIDDSSSKVNTASTTSKSGTSSATTGSTEQYVGSRPTPSMIMKSATSRFESIPLTGKEHANVNRQAAAARAAAAEARMMNKTSMTSAPPVTQSSIRSNNNVDSSTNSTVAELVAMGFPEAKVLNALASANGDQARAVEILLR
jgi:hypothetical protein